MRIAIVHDDLVQWGGAERVLLGICETFPDAPIFTSLYDKDNFFLKKKFANKKIVTSFLQKIPGWRALYKALLPLYPLAFEQFNFDDYDMVISHTTRFAKSIITKPKTKHVCYCHTPPRFLWHLSGEKSYGIWELLMNNLRIYDQISSGRVDYFIAGSQNCATRIKKYYRKKSRVVYPFVDLARFKDIETFNGGYFVVIGRPNKYKRFDLAKQACNKIGVELKIVDGNLSDEMVVRVIAGCKALIIPGVEDFGIIALEAQALGKPVIAFKKGGATETVLDGKTGYFFDRQDIESLTGAIEKLNSSSGLDQNLIKENTKSFSKDMFISNLKQAVASL